MTLVPELGLSVFSLEYTMYLVVLHDWKIEEGAVARSVAEKMGTVAFEARQKLSGGSPVVIATFADEDYARALVTSLTQEDLPAFLVDTVEVRKHLSPSYVQRFVFGEEALKIESQEGDSCEIKYAAIDLLLVAICKAGEIQTTGTETRRKFSLGKTLLAGGVPMTKQVKTEKTVTVEERDESLWLYTHDRAVFIFDRSLMNYNGLGEAMQFTRALNFAHLKNELKRLAPGARYDDRLLKRAAMVRLIGPALNPEVDHDLAFEVLSRSLRLKGA
jgi:hypothetical protein